MTNSGAPLAASSPQPQPSTRQVHVSADELASPDDVAQLICRLSYLDALVVARFMNGDVDKIVDGARDFLVFGEVANV